jgi:hypothetical protein
MQSIPEMGLEKGRWCSALLETNVAESCSDYKNDINFLQLTYKIDMCSLACKKHMLFKYYVLLTCFLIALIKKKCTSHMFKETHV